MKSKKKKTAAVLLIILLLVILLVKEHKVSQSDAGIIVRNEPGEGIKELVLEAVIDDKAYDVPIKIEEREYTKKESRKHIKTAKKEIDETFLGENTSLANIKEAVNIQDTYADGAVNAEWCFDKDNIINSDGTLVEELLQKDEETVTAEVVLSCGKIKEIYTFSFCVYPSRQSKEEQLKKAVDKIEEKNKTRQNVVLPKKLGNKEIVWTQKETSAWKYLPIFAVVIVILLKLKKVEEEKKRKKERERELLMYYPQLVTTLSLLIGAGMSVTKAWERMVVRYKTGKMGRKNAAYEEMCVTWQEIQDGIGERRAYENFGRRCELPQYKKLSSMLAQNLRKGMAGIVEMLSKEAEISLEQRRNLAKKLGEEAGTKLLLPKMIMLGVVMVIVIVPALFSF